MMSSHGFFLLLCWAASLFLAGAQRESVSLDCGLPDDVNYTDDLGYFYVSDAGSIDSGEAKQVASQFKSSPRLYQTLRSFATYRKNCYTLAPTVEGRRYLVRASFMYGNYDGRGRPPIFDVFLGVDFWLTVRLDNASHVFWTEITTKATTGSMSVCLVKTADGNIPFISGLEVRPLDEMLYSLANSSTYLITYKRINTGTSTEDERFKEDPYDRRWTPDYDTYGSPVSTNLTIPSVEGFKVPTSVLRTAESSSSTIFISWPGEPNVQFHIFMYTAEVIKHEENQTRRMFVEMNGRPFVDTFSLDYDGHSMTAFSSSLLPVEDEYKVMLRTTDNSTFGPILNAFEIYKAYDVSGAATYSDDGWLARLGLFVIIVVAGRIQ